MGDIFISHSSADDLSAVRVAEALRRDGHQIFLDSDRQDGIAPGSTWDRTLFHNLRVCDAVVFLNSTSSRTSMWCHTELAVAIDLGKRSYWLDLAENLEPHPILQSVQGISFESSLDDGIQRLIDALRRQGLADWSVARWDDRRPPYPGLEAMDVDDAGVFFGRKNDVLRLVERVDGQLGQLDGDLVVIVGPSGAGKSSLMRAGLVARLKVPNSGWLIVDPFLPGPRPLDRLVKRLAGLSGIHLSEVECRSRMSATGLAALGDWIVDHAEPKAKRLLISLDQAEQLATATNPAEREEFLDVLGQGLGVGSPITIVMTVRSDRFDEAQRLPVIGIAIHEPFVLAPMDRAQLAAVIEGPAKQADLGFDSGLVGHLIDDAMRGSTGETVDALPLLAFTLREMYDLAMKEDRRTITEADYERVGRIEGAIARRAQVAESSLPPDSGPVLERLLPRFVTLSEERLATGRPVARHQLTPNEEIVVKKLEDQRLLTGESDSIRLSHEQLITAWPTLRQVVDDRREDLLLETRLQRQALDWKHGNGELLGAAATSIAAEWLARNETGTDPGVVDEYVHASQTGLRRRRSQRRATVAVIVLGVISLCLGAVALIQRNSAVSEVRVSQSDVSASESTNVLSSSVMTGSLLSLEAYSQSATALARSAVVAAAEQPLESVAHPGVGEVNSIAYDPVGHLMAIGSKRGIVLWDTRTNAMVGRPFDVGFQVNGVAFSPNGSLLAAGQSNGVTALFRVSDQSRIKLLAGDGRGVNEVTAVAFASNGSMLATVTLDGDVHLWNPATGSLISTFSSGASGGLLSVAFSPDGSRLAVGGGVNLSDGESNGVVSVYSVPSGGQALGSYTDKGATISHIAFNPNGSVLAASDVNGNVLLLDPATEQQIGVIRTGTYAVNVIAFNSLGSLIATGNAQGVVQLWDPSSQREAGPPMADGSIVNGLAFAPDGQTLASGGLDGNVFQWTSSGRTPLSTTIEGQSGIVDLSASSNGRYVATANSNGTIYVWSPRTKRLRAHLTDGQDLITTVEFAPHSTVLAVGINDGDVVLYNVVSDKTMADLYGARAVVNFTAFTPRGNTLAVGYGNGAVWLWNAKTDRRIGSLKTGTSLGAVTALTFSPDGSRLAVAEEHGGVTLYNPLSPESKGVPVDVNESINSLAYTSDGSELLAGDANGNVKLLSTSTHATVGSLPGDGSTIDGMAVSPNGTLATVDAGGTIHLWDLATRFQVGAPLTTGSGFLAGLAFSANGSRLVTGDEAGHIVLWPSLLWSTNLDSFKQDLCPRVGENLSSAQWDQYEPTRGYSTTCSGYPTG